MSTLADRRARVADFFATLPVSQGIHTEETVIGDRPATWTHPLGRTDDRAVLHFHFGGYWAGSARSSLAITSYLAAATGSPVLSLDYRLAPENPFPAALEDAVAAYRWLLDHGHPAGRVVFLGESAGGGVVAAALAAVRQAGLPQPAAAVCLSPFVDLTVTADSYRRCADSDDAFSHEQAEEAAAFYLGGHDPRDAFASPVFADFAGLAPLLIQASEDEVLADDARMLADRATATGGHATLETWSGMGHMWHVFVPTTPESVQALDSAASFVRKHQS
ncbi:alpha/beta hydrolase [Kutzneria sp. CA-103260]|uniref:alpha/beta hydrolase n=1 Tax=Kutzneria sp. CA-103260 TaxID=2802641 RepID=UPI001BABDA28|nr:alpha/beta hydrolase [Kutzneria sp. CA-103260]QUQ67079.1 esterase [Kutzneria sp. CA-103260]